MSASRTHSESGVRKQGDPIRAPAQARSRKTMDKILAATEALLAEKSFDRVTIQDVARRSRTGVSSIYARFRDKQALILGLHLRLRDTVFECVDQLADPRRLLGKNPEQIAAAVIPPCVRFYRVHGALIRAALAIDEREMRERQAYVLKYAAAKFTALLVPKHPQHAEAIEVAVDGCVQLVVSVMYVSLLFGGVAMGRRPLSDKALTMLLVKSCSALLMAAQQGED